MLSLQEALSEGTPSVQFGPVKRTRLSDELVVRITNMVLQGALRPGDRLPPERELAARFSVNRNSLREALRKLESMGLVSIRQGDGVFVQDHKTQSGLEFVVFLLTNGIGLDKQLILDLAEVRRFLASGLITLAVRQAEKSDIAFLREFLQVYDQLSDSQRLSGRPDFEFFKLIAQASKNRVFVYMLNSVREVFENVSALYFQLENDTQLAIETYNALVDAIESKDELRAKEVFEKRMKQDDKVLEKLLSAK